MTNPISIEQVPDTMNSCNSTGCRVPVKVMYHVWFGNLLVRLCYVHLYVLYDQIDHMRPIRSRP